MRSRLLVVLGVRAEDALQVTPAEAEDVVEGLPWNSADPALRERVRSRSPNGCLYYIESLGPEHLVEGAGELRVWVSEQHAHVLETSGDGEVPGLLGDPGGVGSAGRSCDLDPPGAELDEEQ